MNKADKNIIELYVWFLKRKYSCIAQWDSDSGEEIWFALESYKNQKYIFLPKQRPD